MRPRRSATQDADLPQQQPESAGQEAQGSDPVPGWQRLPIEDQAYLLHLRGMSLRAIAGKLRIDKDTANRYVNGVKKEMAAERKKARTKQLELAIARYRAVQDHAYAQFDVSGEAALLNTVANAEREIARLQGLYDHEVEAEDGITITISRRSADAHADRS